MTDQTLTRIGIALAALFAVGAVLAALCGINIFNDLPTNLG